MNAFALTAPVCLFALSAACSTVASQPAESIETKNGYSLAQIKRGEQLVNFGACHDCHTPWKYDPMIGAKVPDMSRMLSGHPEGAPVPAGELGADDIAVIGPTFTSFRMPFGLVYAANLTPDMETGTGTWTEQMFLNIFRKARHLGGDGRPVLPPMPWPMVATLPDEDIKAIFAYLRTVKPIRNSPPVAQPPAEVQQAIRNTNDKLLGRIRGQPVNVVSVNER
jgi:mono/diheme cytochrome c family protein